MIFFLVPNYYIWFTTLYFCISFDSKIPENSCSFGFYNWFSFVFIPFFPFQFSIILTHFSMKTMFNFILNYYITPSGLFTLGNAGGLSLEYERQKVSLSLRDSSQYSGLSQQCCSSSNFQLFLPFHQAFGTVPYAPTSIIIDTTFMFLIFFLVL